MPKSSRLAFAAVFALLAVYACHSWYGPDVYYHLSWGRDLFEGSSLVPRPRTLVAQPLPANVYWIFQGWLHATYSAFGMYGVSAGFAALWALVLINWIYLIGGSGRALGAPLALVFLILAQPRFEERPEVFSYAFALLAITLLRRLATSRRPSREVAGLFALETLWCGTHGYFPLGPLLASTAFFTERGRWRRGAAALLATVIPTVAGPFGAGIWRVVALYARLGAKLKDLNQELFMPSVWPPAWPTTLFWSAWLAVVGLALWSLRRADQRFGSLVALGGALLSAQSVRNAPLLALLAAPLLGDWRHVPRREPRWPGVLVAPACAVLAILFISPARGAGDLSTFGVKPEWASYPIGAARALGRDGVEGLVFTDSYDGGYVEFALPRVRVAGDSYFSDPDLTRAYFTAIKEPAAFRRFLSGARFAALLLNVENLAVVDMVLGDPAWKLAYADSHRALFYPAGQGPKFDLADAEFWHGESLANANNAFGPACWAAIAAHRGRGDVLLKILTDVSAAPRVPPRILAPIARYAERAGDAALGRALAGVKACAGYWNCR